MLRKLTKAEVPHGSRIGVLSDIHIGIHDVPAVRAAIEYLEKWGCTHVILNGDIYDCATVAPHKKKAALASLQNGSLLHEASTGRWILEWALTRPCIMGVGNHEDWINDLAVHPGLAGTYSVKSALGLPDNLEILDWGYQIRLGSLVIEHGDLFKSFGQNPAQRVLNVQPDCTTIIGHVHRESFASKTTPDEDGVMRTRAAYSTGHLSIPEEHHDYAGRAPNWQQGFSTVEVWWEGDRPRFHVDLVEIHRDRRNRPVIHRGCP